MTRVPPFLYGLLLLAVPFFNRTMAAPPADYTKLAQSLLYAVRTGEESAELRAALQAAHPDSLAAALTTDGQRTAFWLNLYNAYVQYLLKTNPDRYRKRSDFFTDRQIPVAGARLSLDAIEHGILRRSRTKWSLGYIGKLFPGAFEKKFRVDHPDYRIHFALNCGARSCPPIAYYVPEQLDRQLNLATANYLQGEALYDSARNRVHLPAIMSWFRADFGGRKGMYPLLERWKVIPAGARPKIRFKKYDWTLFLDNYKNDTNE
ncbi:MAG TPA: DUF547 domain-containing protein [Chitinophagaceae bacterium]|jgi:hypothetical protein|nr:DUF547 domain-containing protein [Chitinophagaceae bacterium]